MRKLFLFSVISIFYFNANAHCCVRCVPGPNGPDCWLSNSKCEKQPDGTGGSHCPNGYNEDCSCEALICCGGSQVGNPIDISNMQMAILISDDYKLSVKNLSTGQITFVADLVGSIENKLFRFEPVQGSNNIIMRRASITEDTNGNITSQTPDNDIIFTVPI